MKSKVANGQNAKMSRIGLLSLVTLMCVSLSTGTALAADMSVWQVKSDGTVGKLVEPGISTSRAEEATKLLIKDSNYKGFAEKFKSNSAEMVEGIRAALISDKAGFDKNVKAIVDGLKALSGKEAFGSVKKKAAMDKLLEKLATLKFADVDSSSGEHELLATLLDLVGADREDVLKALGLTDEKKEKKDDEKPTEVDNTTAPVSERVPGEVTDEELQRQAQIECDKRKAELAAAEQKAADDAERAFNELRNFMEAQARNNNKKEDRAPVTNNSLFDQLARRFGGGDEATPPVQPPQTPPATPPATAQQQPDQNSALDEPVPNLPQQGGSNLPLAQTAPSRPIPVAQMAKPTVKDRGEAEGQALAQEVTNSKNLGASQLPMVFNANGQLMMAPYLAGQQLQLAMNDVDQQKAALSGAEDALRGKIAELKKKATELGDTPPGADDEAERLNGLLAKAESNARTVPNLQNQLQAVKKAADEGDRSAQDQAMQLSQQIATLNGAVQDAQDAVALHKSNTASIQRSGSKLAEGLQADISALTKQLNDVTEANKALDNRAKQIQMMGSQVASQQAPNNALAGTNVQQRLQGAQIVPRNTLGPAGAYNQDAGPRSAIGNRQTL
ncbi:hypothetical protein K2X33_08565 [bacterium]|nr:hypothetical protein [bacterium]